MRKTIGLIAVATLLIACSDASASKPQDEPQATEAPKEANSAQNAKSCDHLLATSYSEYRLCEKKLAEGGAEGKNPPPKEEKVAKDPKSCDHLLATSYSEYRSCQKKLESGE